MIKKSIDAVPSRDLEQYCEYRFTAEAPFWHLYTDGNKVDIIFSTSEDFRIGMNLMAICCLRCPKVKVITFELMNNHLHIILSGEKQKCIELFDMFKLLLTRCWNRHDKAVCLKHFDCELIEITSLHSLRNEIVYVNRNGFIARPDCTPFSYPWGTGAAFFNPFLRMLPSIDYERLTVRQKRNICHSNNTDLPPNKAKVFNDIIIPSSYCHIEEGEAYFRSAHQYFHHLSRKYEAYSEIAKRLHESIFISDEEMYSAVCSLCLKLYNVKSPTLLGAKERIEMAKKMHQDYNASNRQIRNILKLDKNIVETMFPHSTQ